jgi:hypothetical protein
VDKPRFVLAMLLSSLGVAAWVPMAGAAPIDRGKYVQWGLESYNETVRTLGLPGERLFAESANLGGARFGGSGGKAYVWPLSAQFRVQNSLARLDSATYVPVLREFSDQLYAGYWDPRGGYRSGVGANATRFYDDNAHLAVALAEAYNVTGDAVYLGRARETLDFVLSGEDGAGGGGIYWAVGDRSFKDSAATLQGARAALMLHQATGEQAFFQRATKLYDWAKRTTQLADGMFMEKLYLTGPNAGRVGDWDLVNFAGQGLSANLEFYDSTGDVRHLNEAKRIANRTLSRYFGAGGRINDEGYWAYELVDGLIDLQARDPTGRWADAVDGALTWLHNNKRDPNGHYGLFWGREGPQTARLSAWHLNDQAPVARAYLHTALSVPEPTALALLLPCAALCLRRGRRRTAR